MRVYLIRHPEPVDIGGLCYGRTDMRVDEATVTRTATAIAARLSPDIFASAPVYCSPLSRCLDLARQLASPQEPIPDDDLVEINFGAWEGLAWDSVPRDAIDAWARDVWGYQPGGGESAAMVATRWHRWLNRMHRSNAETAIAVTHAGVIRVALSRASQSNEPITMTTPIPFGAVYHLDIG